MKGTHRVLNAGHQGIYLKSHSAAPPAVDEYDAWFERQLAGTRGRQTKLTGTKLRRMVIMRRQGETYKDIAVVAGVSACVAHDWLTRLPEGLAA